LTKQKIRKLSGTLRIIGDKSISHRSLILSSICVGKTEITNLLESEDVFNTINILRDLGIQIKKKNNKWVVLGRGTNSFIQPKNVLDCGNSGTTARLMLGAVSTNPIYCTFVGDKSLSNRPMRRVTDHLEKIGCKINLTNKEHLPLTIKGSEINLPLVHKMSKPSAQIKSAIILSALNTEGKTTIIEPEKTRDHTELLLKYLKVKFEIRKTKHKGRKLIFNGPYEIKSKNIHVPGDPSSAAFILVGALITPNSKIKLLDVSLNKTRISYLSILKKMGGKIMIKKTKTRSGEQLGTITASTSSLKGVTIPANLAPYLIDEYPILSIAASQAKGVTYMQGLDELKHKESNRIKSIIEMLKSFGIKTKTKNNSIKIYGSPTKSVNCKKPIKVYSDHRIALSASILGIISNNSVKLDDEGKSMATSYPSFKKDLKKILMD
tara:strand:+ start:77 stop:1384 length:1308 start_codon:yes stop_codon:yes gene_type:complete